ncbi:MAG: diguanylate cyclase [Rhizorhabdus sp.]|nr:diguanylate cyclase [Rhizorhabdus sp.]
MIDDQPFSDRSEEETERSRLRILAGLNLLDTPPEQEYDSLVACAHRLLGGKVAAISLIDETRQWFKAKIGLDFDETPREYAFCQHAMRDDDVLIVADTRVDPRFASNPAVMGPPHVRFYAGAPIRASEGSDGARLAIGSLCIIDDVPRDMSSADARLLRDLANIAEALIRVRSLAKEMGDLVGQREAYFQDLDRRHRQFRQAERMADIGSWRLGVDNQFTEWSDQIYAIYGLPKGEKPALGTALDFYPLREREAIMAAIRHTIETGQPFDIEADFIAADGSQRRVRSMGELELQDGKPSAVIGVFQDITARHQMEQALRRSARLDDLTHLANRAHFNQVIEERIVEARLAAGRLALLLIDLDGFKQINDRFGHLAGDRLLQHMAAQLKQPYLAGCFVARIGGDEFVVLVSDPADCDRLDEIMQALLGDLRHSVAIGGDFVRASGTIGAAWLEADVRDRSELFHRADIALYEAKRAQPGTARIFGDDRLLMAGIATRP